MPLEKTAAAFSIFPPAVSTVSHGQGRRPSFVRPLDWPLKSRNVQKVVPRAVAVQVETLFPLFIIFPLLYISPSFLLLCAWFLFVQIERKCSWYTFRSPRGIRELNEREREEHQGAWAALYRSRPPRITKLAGTLERATKRRKGGKTKRTNEE